MNRQPLKIGSIGAGGRGKIVQKAHRPDEGIRLVAVCDLSEQVLTDYREEFGPELEVTRDWREIVAREDLDAIFVTTPDDLHAEHAVPALEAGKTVYLEKPMGISIEQCDRILDAAAAHGDRLYVGHNMRFFPVMQKIKQLIDDDAIGQVQAVWCRHFIDYGGDAYFKDWHSQRRHVNSLLLQKGAHDLDLIHWFAGGHTTRVTALGKLSVYNQTTDRRQPDQRTDTKFNKANWPPLSQKGLSPVIDVEDHSMVLLQLDNGVQASYQQCHYSPDGCRNYTILGTRGRIENEGDHTFATYEAKVHLWNQRVGGQLDQRETFPIPLVEGSHGGADPKIIDGFLDFLRGNPRRGATPLDARNSVAAGVAATQSLRKNGQPIDVPPYPGRH